MSWQLGLARLEAELGRSLQRAARKAGGAERLWRADSQKLGELLRLDAAAVAGLEAIREQFNPTVELTRLAAEEISFTASGDSTYPRLLAETFDPPFGLFTTGNTHALDRLRNAPVIAVVGSRRPTAVSCDLARRLSHDLAAHGAVIVSGLANGIDTHAHRGALDADATTIAVTGNSPEIVYPRANSQLRLDILRSGALVSEYWPGTPPAPWRFPARNRITAGVAHAVLVVEAAERSGSLITADFALELGRPVFAVPHTPVPAVAGSNALLRAGAHVCESAEDIIDALPELNWTTAIEGTTLG